jgi:peptidoglycan/LPS O-acetylase OafA/YrhL
LCKAPGPASVQRSLIASTEATASPFADPDRPAGGAVADAPAERTARTDERGHSRRHRRGEQEFGARARFHLSGLDGLRAVAVAGVLLYHGTDWLPGGFLGVDLFFVISGFLITTLLLDELRRTGTIAIGSFLARRARRLFPALAVVLVTTLLAAAIVWRDVLEEVQSSVLAAAAYVMNWWLIVHEADYFAAAGRPPPLQHVWSLAIEEQFYLLWPPVVLLLGLWLRGNVRVGVAIAASLGAVASASWLTALAIRGNVPFDTDVSRLYFGTDTHASGLLLGCAAAAVVSTRLQPGHLARRPRNRRGDLIGLAALAGFVWMMLEVTEFDPWLYRYGFALAAVLCTIVVVASTRPGSVLGRSLDVAPLRWIGVRSYGIYLWHWPVFVVTRPVLDVSLSQEALLVPRLALTVGIAALSYRFLEQPIRREGFRPWLRRVTAFAARPTGVRRPVLAAAGAVLAAALVFGFVRDPIGSSAAQSSGPAGEATVKPPPAVPAGTAAPARRPSRIRVTAIGDSVLEGAGPALRRVFPFLTVDADVGRRAPEVFDEIAWLKLGGRLGRIVVIATGANGIVEPDALDEMLEKLADRRRVVLVTVHVPRPWQDLNNETFAEAAEGHANTTVADWHAAAQEHPEWLYEDGVHVRPEYASEFAEIIRAAALDPVAAHK